MDAKVKELIKFEIIEQNEKKVLAEMLVNEQLPSFAGHFPGNPILPAVSIIDISLHMLSFFKPQVSYTNISIKRSKFMGMVHPNQKVQILAESDDGATWKIQWTSSSDNSRLAQVQLSL